MHCLFNGTLLISVLPPVLVVEFILGVLSNGLALWIFCFHMRPWKSSTVLLFNLAMADFMLNMALPFRTNYYMSKLNWAFGGVFCNICLFMLAINRSGSTFFLMAIAVDRYLRVVHPHHPINSLSVSKAILGAFGIWLLPISMNAPIFTLKHNTSYCETFMIQPENSNDLTWRKFEFLFSFYMPLSVILYCTINITTQLRKRQLGKQAKIRKALCFITVVVVLFIICFLPSNITQVLILIKTSKATQTLSSPHQVCQALDKWTTAFYISITLTYLNSMLDPVVYYFSSPAFKNIYRKALHLPQAESIESAEKKTRETGSVSLNQL